MSKWIEFREVPRPDYKGNTKLWHVVPKEGVGYLGEVRWYGPWRQYAFYPNIQTVYERQCLRDIANFCEERTIDHRRAKPPAPAELNVGR